MISNPCNVPSPQASDPPESASTDDRSCRCQRFFRILVKGVCRQGDDGNCASIRMSRGPIRLADSSPSITGMRISIRTTSNQPGSFPAVQIKRFLPIHRTGHGETVHLQNGLRNLPVQFIILGQQNTPSLKNPEYWPPVPLTDFLLYSRRHIPDSG